jgi:NAD+ kinase
VVVPARERVIIDVEQEQRSAVMLTVDGQTSFSLSPGDRIFLCRSPYDALFIASPRQVFYRALQTKLNWSGGVPGA